ncbi:hypothetical protein [Actinomadura sp. 6N118]|uniref:hypothetical protein n=1 Tax=Actinomadura sp. 6N118 TaxID=3375151 RepID=UPI00378BBCB4
MTELRLQIVATHKVRHADADVGELVELVMGLLTDGIRLIDLARHDTRGTRFEVRAELKE